jgi:hypothetical protein
MSVPRQTFSAPICECGLLAAPGSKIDGFLDLGQAPSRSRMPMTGSPEQALGRCAVPSFYEHVLRTGLRIPRKRCGRQDRADGNQLQRHC